MIILIIVLENGKMIIDNNGIWNKKSIRILV
jgi:hypothetical protein